ncbi:MAG: uracil-DNA glycosylase [Proteobacteria bacterium]|nr:uracil-DNA glycosylase [Pseudomonadota bacterium]
MDRPDISTAELVALLEWYHEAGVDLAIDEAPHDHFAEADAARRQKAQPVARVVPSPASPEQAAQSARALAAEAPTLDALRSLMAGFEGCELRRTARQLVFSDGIAGARVMLVGEAPGRDEDEQGLPFIGRSGKLLDRMLAAIGLDRSSVYIANVIPWRPPGNRTPTPQEIAICLPFIERHIALAAPDVLVCLGGPSAQTLLNQRDGILRLRGRWFDYDCNGRVIPALATLHPAYLLRQPAQKKLAWRDLRALQAKLRG